MSIVSSFNLRPALYIRLALQKLMSLIPPRTYFANLAF